MLPDEMTKVTHQWIDRAEEDLRTAEYILILKEDCPFGTVCFHAEQCVEKYLKALLVFQGIDFPKTHNIPEVLNLVPASIRPALSAEEQERLTDYATVLRYPGDWEPITREDAEAAVETARKVREAVRRHLPGIAQG
ncbi:MAG: HEPN domain-containing protein [Candidatus Omnitrophica bacterium]|nr:HEPN domain-containing protein [Candidatus Omnitrophota bacterium]